MNYLTKFIISLIIICSGCDTISNLPPDPSTDNIHFTLKENINTPLALPQALIKDGDSDYFYVALKNKGVFIYKKGTSSSQKIKTIPISELSNLHAMNIYKQGNFLYIALGDFFGTGSKAGIAIIDISTPNNPIVKDVWTSAKKIEGSAIIKVQGNYAFLGAMDQGVYVFNVSNKNGIKLHSKFKPNINFPTSNPNKIQHPNARGMDIVGDIMYLCYDAGGIRVIDISNKKKLKEIGRYINTDSNLKQQAYNNIMIHDNYAYVAVDYCGLEILNISNPKNITQTGWWNPWKCNTPSNNWFNSKGHTNQLYFSSEKNIVFISSGKSELNMIDVSNPSNPIEKGSYGTTNNKKATWGLTISNDEVYVLYITSFVPFQANWAGIKILDWK